MLNWILAINSFNQREDLLTIDKFKLISPKVSGVSWGGIFADLENHKWMIKEPQWGELENGITEYVAGGIYQEILGDYAPHTDLIYDQNKHEVYVGSKFLPNFQTLFEFCHFDENKYLKPSYQGKPIYNFANVLAAVKFMQDVDAHPGNVGIVEESWGWHIAKIDHGFAFKENASTTLEHFKDELRYMHSCNDIQMLGFENLYQSIQMVCNIDYKTIENIVNERCQKANLYIKQLPPEKANHLNMGELKNDMLTRMKKQLLAFDQIKLGLDLDKAIKEDDVKAFQAALAKGVNPCAKYCSFYEPSSHLNTWDSSSYLNTWDSNHSAGIAPLDVAIKLKSHKVKQFLLNTYEKGQGHQPSASNQPKPLLFAKQNAMHEKVKEIQEAQLPKMKLPRVA